MIELGSQKSDTPKTKTLRAWLKDNPDSAVRTSQVKVIFTPGKFGGYTFITELNFKVVVERVSPLNDYLEENLANVLEQDVCLFINITNADKGSWSLVNIDTSLSRWEVFGWGYKCVETKAAKTDAKKNRDERNARKKAEQMQLIPDSTIDVEASRIA